MKRQKVQKYRSKIVNYGKLLRPKAYKKKARGKNRGPLPHGEVEQLGTVAKKVRTSGRQRKMGKVQYKVVIKEKRWEDIFLQNYGQLWLSLGECLASRELGNSGRDSAS